MIPDKQKNPSTDVSKSRARKLISALTALVMLSCLASAASAQGGNPHGRALGDSRVFAPLPAQPGFPESIAVNGDRVYVSGGAQFGYFVPPAVLAFDIETG